MPKGKPKYEFGGPLGAAGIVFGLPLLMNLLYFACNDVAGCPAPILLRPTGVLTWENLKRQIPWPSSGAAGFLSWEASAWTMTYYALSLILYRVLPANEVLGSKLRESGKPLTYRFNAFSSTILQLAICGLGTLLYGANFVVWTFLSDHYLEILSFSILFAYVISILVYVYSFSVIKENHNLRELAKGGHTGNIIYDFYIGRELNPRFYLPVFGEIDLKTWLEMRPGLTGWILFDLAFIAKQYRSFGYVSDSIIFITAVQSYYVLEGQYSESGILGMMDITTDGLGFMLTFGDIVWVPFLYSTQCRYLSVHPVHLGFWGLLAVSAIFSIGVYIFRASNSQKYMFRTNPQHPKVKNLSSISTKRGTKLLVSGWWGSSRHINYFGDWLQAFPFCLPTGFAGYTILAAGQATLDLHAKQMLDGRQVIQGHAQGWGMLFTYLYGVYFAVLLMHRERRDDAACAEKYGEDWDRYKKLVKWRILPGIY